VATEFKHRFNPEHPDEAIECDSCDYPGRVSLFENTHTEAGDRDLWLCEVCANTLLSIATKYPHQFRDSVLYRSIAMLGNMLLEEIRNPTTEADEEEIPMIFTLSCRKCGTDVVVKSGDSVNKLRGWVYTSKTEWRCPSCGEDGARVGVG